MPFICFRCNIAKKEERRAGWGEGVGRVGDLLESPVETNSIFMVFLRICMCVFLRLMGGGGKLLI